MKTRRLFRRAALSLLALGAGWAAATDDLEQPRSTDDPQPAEPVDTPD